MLVDVAVAVRVGVCVSVRVAVDVGVTVGVGSTSSSGQKPPARVRLPEIERPASGWPALPLRRCVPLVVTEAPPPSMLLRRRS